MQRLHEAEVQGDKERIAEYEEHCTSVLDRAQNWGPEWHEKVKELMWQRYKLHNGLYSNKTSTEFYAELDQPIPV